MDSDLQALLYTIIIDSFLLIICHFVWVIVTDSDSTLPSRLLSPTRTLVRSLRVHALPTFMGGVVEEEELKRQEQAKRAVEGVIVTEAVVGGTLGAAAAGSAVPITPRRLNVLSGDESEKMMQRRSSLPHHSASKTPRIAAASSSSVPLSPSSSSSSLTTAPPASSSGGPPSLSRHRTALSSIFNFDSLSLPLPSDHSQITTATRTPVAAAIFDDDDADAGSVELQELDYVVVEKQDNQEENGNEENDSTTDTENDEQLYDDDSLPTVSDSLRSSLGTTDPVVRVVYRTSTVSESVANTVNASVRGGPSRHHDLHGKHAIRTENVYSPFAEIDSPSSVASAVAASPYSSSSSLSTSSAPTSLDTSSAATTRVVLIPAQEDLRWSDQTLVTPPSSAEFFSTFSWVDHLLDRIFPPIRMLSVNLTDGFVYLRLNQLLIVLVAMMCLMVVPVLIPVHEYTNSLSASTTFKSASIGAVPAGSKWYLAHFILAYVLCVLFYIYVRVLIRACLAANQLDDITVNDKRESVVQYRTVQITHLSTEYTEERLKEECLELVRKERKVKGRGNDGKKEKKLGGYSSSSANAGGGTSSAYSSSSSLTSASPINTPIDDTEILSVLLFHDTSTLRAIWSKLSKLKNASDRLMILAVQIQKHPNARIRNVWVKLLADATFRSGSVAKRLIENAVKREKLIAVLTEEIIEHWRRSERQRGGEKKDVIEEEVKVGDEPVSQSQQPSSSPTLPLHPDTSSGSVSGTSIAGITLPRLPRQLTKLARRVNLHPHPSSHRRPLAGETESSSSKFSGQAFLTFRHTVSACKLIQHSRESRYARSYDISFAPPPSDIIWNNLAQQEAVVVGCTRWLIANSSILALLMFLGIPMLLLHSITTIVHDEVDDLNLSPVKTETTQLLLFFFNYLTTLVMWLINWNLLPAIISKVIDFETHATHSSYQESKFMKSSLFLFAIMILLPIFTMTTVSDILLKFRVFVGEDDDPAASSSTVVSTSWYTILSSAFFVNSGLYFAQYLTHEILVSVAINLSFLPRHLSRIYSLRTALTQKELQEAQSEASAVLSYDRLCATFGLVLINSITVPLLLPFGLMYFLVQYIIDTYSLRRYTLKSNTSKSILLVLSTRTTLLYFILWQALMSCLFFSQNLTNYHLLGVFFLCTSVSTACVYALKRFPVEVDVKKRMETMKLVDEKWKMFEKDLSGEAVTVEQLHQQQPRPSEQEETKESIERMDSEEMKSELPSSSPHMTADPLSTLPPTVDPVTSRMPHPHVHRAPAGLFSSVTSSSSTPSYHVDTSICPECLYRHPVWREIEADEEVMQVLQAKVDEMRKAMSMAEEGVEENEESDLMNTTSFVVWSPKDEAVEKTEVAEAKANST